MSPRIPDPPPDPIVGRLRVAEDQPDTEDVIALNGFIGPGVAGGFRIHADHAAQRWLEVPAIVDSQQVNPGDELSRSVVWVDRQMMLEDLFEGDPGQSDGRLDGVRVALGDVPFSTWNLIPETRLAAAGLLGLIAYDED